MIRLASPRGVLAGCALVLVVHGWILVSASWNRRGPAVTMDLTERELALPPVRPGDDEGGLALQLTLLHDAPASVRLAAIHRSLPVPPVRYAWFDRGKLVALGFGRDVGRLEAAGVAEAEGLPRPVFLALEYDGPAWRAWLEAEERKAPGDVAIAARLAIERVERSRLVPVDADLDAGALAARHPGCAVIEGLAQARTVVGDGHVEITGGFAGLPTGMIHVPPAFAAALRPLMPRETWEQRRERERARATDWPEPAPPRFRAALAVGRRHEPWLAAVVVPSRDALPDTRR